uniref:Uncharacterized protein n=1 Tax=Erythrolobus australicus TaxID=1077150 RepID=A0A7S1TL86_9RHOD
MARQALVVALAVFAVSSCPSPASVVRASAAPPSAVSAAAFAAPGALSDRDLDLEHYVSQRFVRSGRVAKYSEAEEEIFEIDDLAHEFRWMSAIQAVYAGILAFVGLFTLKTVGRLWDLFLKGQEDREMEEEMRLTGRFIDTRAARLNEEEKLKREAKEKRRLARIAEGLPPEDEDEDGDDDGSDDDGTGGARKSDAGPDKPRGGGDSDAPGGMDISALERMLKKND